ncbi:ABC transporter permease and ATPase component protein [Pandoraea thiooxydans]|uniref:ABC transporter permease n=1 Tax=Pandoraea thiooxydans TaxID=445709 RepID=A0A0G3EJT1_9BURK|nr:ABC transporter ATP-binding protein/permease [Pandoraea thiooxydans]AKJ67298.1 ABC transporter permease [Pandoraea thiooxydans]APR94304.1 ABC transporter permease and ATPase component protein [Pandoraea thiooxydans]
MKQSEQPDLTYAESDERRAHFNTSVWQLILPYWKSDERWVSGSLALFMIGVSFGQAYIGVWRNGWIGKFYDAISGAHFGKLSPLLAIYLIIIVVTTAVTIASYVANEVLILRWRTWLTNYLVDRWTHNETYFRIERDKLLDNADQRISEDAKNFVSTTVNLVFGLISVPVTTVTFSVLLWRISGDYVLHVGGSRFVIPGYMVIAVFLYTGITLLVTHLIGRRLIPVNVRQQKVEADFRALMLQIREGAEQVALYGGAHTEAARLKRTFWAIRDNTWKVIRVTSDVMFSTQVPGQITSILPALLVLPQLTSGALTLGGLMRITSAFGSLDGTLSFFPQTYQSFASWRAIVRRLLALLDAVEPRDLAQTLSLELRDDGAIDVGPLNLATMRGAVLSQIPAFRIEKGARCLIRGRSGAGKSTLLRALAGIWPYGDGVIGMPSGVSTIFVPQKSYVPVGTLKQALAYPADEADVTDEAACRALTDCGLVKYRGCLHEVDRWGSRLSGGEQQRLAFARIFLRRPTHIFLDESTSALDDVSERRLYSHLIETLPESTLVSVAHRKEVEEFHTQFVDLSAATVHPMGTESTAAGDQHGQIAWQRLSAT